ncbi:MAG: family transcriptional regulator [Verrucomicrobiales bacterium]|nr:family transcriptional regulator [Verrucomicrobiales bacterium]
MSLQGKNKTTAPLPLRLKIKQDVIAGIEAELLRCVRGDQTMSRVELARRLTLAPSTVSIYVDRLIAEGFLLEKEKVERDYGRPPKALGLNPGGGRFIGIDFEARNLMATAIDFSQQPLKHYRDKILASDSVDQILGKIERSISQLMGETKQKTLAIGVGVPGSIDNERGIALHYRHITGWKNIPLAEKLSKRFGVPVFLENNIRSMALAELWFGQGRGEQNFICVGVRSGIGAGIVLDGHLYRGANNLAGEIADWPCPESPASSGQSITRLEEAVSLRALKKGDIAGAANVLATVLLQLNLAFNPAKIILAGAMTTFGEDFLNLIQENLKSLADSSEVPKVVNSQLGDFNGAIGAAALAVHHWKPARK